MRIGLRGAASAAALVTATGLAGWGAYEIAREDPAPTTTSTTTTTAMPTAAVVRSIADALRARLDVTLSQEEADCLATALLEVVPVADLEQLTSLTPLSALPADDRERLVQHVIACVPEPTAAALLGGPSTTSPPVQLPDEGT
ncbi:MAG: hypothetical protein ACT4OV_12685 [Microthrixaceae bacterium]